jgi:hypothetical protein
MKVIAVYQVKRTNKVVRILSGSSSLAETLVFEDRKDIPKGLTLISRERAAEITGNYSLFGK